MRNPTIRRTILTAAAIGGLGLLGACHSAPDEAPETNMSNLEAPVTEVNTTTTTNFETPAPAPSPTSTTAAITVSNASDTPPDAQVFDDADATGMTARVNRDTGTANEADVAVQEKK